MPARPLLELRDVSRRFQRGASAVVALDRVSLEIAAGEFVAVSGPSGAGKSTLLAILGCLDRPTGGAYAIDGVAVAGLDDRALSRLRGRSFGFVFQAFHLLPALSVAENVETPLLYGDLPEPEWRGRALAALEAVGLAHRAGHRPAELSGGECQRAALARAIVTDPHVLLADEPTGNLDGETGDAVAELLVGLHRRGRSLVVVTHNERLATRAERRLRLRDGRVEPGGEAPS